MTLLAESDNSSSEVGFFYSTWGAGLMGNPVRRRFCVRRHFYGK